MKKIFAAIFALLAFVSTSYAQNALVIDAGYSTVAASVQNRLQSAGRTVTVVTSVPSSFSGYQEVWDLRYATALTSTETTQYSSFITNGGFVYFTTENPGCCQARNNSVAALITALGGGTTTIGANSQTTANISGSVNTTYMTNGITVNFAAISAIVNSQGIPLIKDSSGLVQGMSWIGRAGALAQGVTGTIVTVADINWMDSSRMVIGGTATAAQQQNVQALDDIIKGIDAGTIGGTISAQGNGSAASNGAAQQQAQNQAPTVVSTAAGTPTVTSTSTNGTATSTNASTRGNTTTTSTAVLGPTTTTVSKNDVASKSGTDINVTRTTTVTGVTPRTTTFTSTTPITTVTTTVTPKTTTTTTTPVTITTYSDGSTTSTNGTPVVTTATQNITTTSTSTANEVVVTTVNDTITQTASSDQSSSVSAVGLKDALAISRFNPFLVDVLSTKDGAWATPSYGYARATGSVRTSMLGFGAQKTVEDNTLGIAGTFSRANSHGYLNSTASADSYGATAYILNKQSEVWTKASVGFGVSEYDTSTSLPIFALTNNGKVRAKNYYADLTFYTGQDFSGFRPLVGVTAVNSVISSKSESGSPLLSTLPTDDRVVRVNPYAGIRYDFNDSIGVETRVTQSKDFKTVGQIRLQSKYEVFDNVFFTLQGGFDRGSGYTAASGMAGIKINF